MKYTFHILFLLLSVRSQGVNYYVSPAGSNGNNGLSPTLAFATLQYAAGQTLPGDTVFVMNGMYSSSVYAGDVLDIYTSGTPGNYIVYTNFPGQNPVIYIDSQWAGIRVQGASYIVINGFTVIGNNNNVTYAYAISQQDSLDNPVTSGLGIHCAQQAGVPGNMPHHDIISNCKVTQCGGNGISANHSDYMTIENNTVSDCGFFSPNGPSGISMWQNWNSDSSTAIKNYITGNTCYNNMDMVPFHNLGVISDGNGIILDDSRNTQKGSTLGVYVGRTYIANNVVYDNGGRAINCNSSDKAVIVNNTCYKNDQSPSVKDGEITAYHADSVYIINNIVYPDSAVRPMNIDSATNIYVDHNLWAANASIANPMGTNVVAGDPDFVYPSSDSLLADFNLLSGSAAINAGTRFYAPATDILGNPRPTTDSVDIGAYQYQANNSISNTSQMPGRIGVYPNPCTGVVYLTIPAILQAPLTIYVYNSMGAVIKTLNAAAVTTGRIEADISAFADGIYFAAVFGNGKAGGVVKFCKMGQ